ncbi:MAG TPA: electron transfer flavoprotein subunit alpha/FixB family protein [Candidatus Limnocylindrales bacterium]|nr:electron transfer flavoprotein subunit alpha/FixB family protein [Candidatus Limnocylindrales bacterium]
MKVAVVAETKGGAVRKIALEMLAEARRLAGAAGGSVGAVVIGPVAAGEAERLAKHGADRVVHVDGAALERYAPEAYAGAVKRAVEALAPDVLFFGATAQGKDLAPRAAARLGAGLASDCVGFEWKDGALVARRPVFAGKAFAQVAFGAARPQIASVRPNTYKPAEADAGRSAAVETIALGEVRVRARVTAFEATEGGVADLTEATIIVSGGRAMGGPDNFELLRKLCKVLGATMGASRAAVDAGWIDHSYQVGQTGKVVNPTLYFAVGISGAIQHLAGMSSSRTIVAINKDKEAPIFKLASYGIVGDLYKVVPALTEEFAKVLKE